MSLKTLLEAVRAAADVLGRARAQELEINQDIALGRVDAVKRIMASGNDPVTGKPFSYTSAERLVETDPAFATLIEQRKAHQFILAAAEAGYFIAKAEVMAHLLSVDLDGTVPSVAVSVVESELQS